jgi:hypothetical protein
MAYLPVEIPCIMKAGNLPAMITGVINAPDCDNFPIRLVIDGGSYPVEEVMDDKGIELSSYAASDKWYFTEWLRSILKEKLSGRKEYVFNEDGLEYWYNSTDFRRHYTCEEG